ncbi:hypothetical protein DSCO28_52800 [Desulfosarcina ovata subsp. sediminis]|uniref:PABS domain-containing protein n=1 Tax=Desulfosarcina ovata subsp. sediminis TaxID=885957 RepID=A0A5K7ZX10_9BACT|nr:hypothetical protein DSCO28_52800 [Desulfosarcina ovata subsp. sediminis]
MVVTTGIASVPAQLVFVREYLAQFQGNEIVIALIFFCWLMFGGVGTALARGWGNPTRSASPTTLSMLSSLLAVLAVGQVVAIRWLRDLIFLPGVSVGFYSTLGFVGLTLWPYAVLVGFVLPYSLRVARQQTADYPGNRIYMADNAGDVAGGAIFSIGLVFWLTPLQVLLAVHLPLLAALCRLQGSMRRRTIAGTLVAMLTLGAGVAWERETLPDRNGRRVFYAESRYGRIEVVDNEGEITLFNDGQPGISSQDPALAEELVHFPLAQVSHPRRLLLVSTVGSMMAEVIKYHPEMVDYVELDPLAARLQHEYGLVASIPGLKIIADDARAYLMKTAVAYDAILVNLSEPDTYQVNRFFTAGFFALAKAHLVPGGVLSFAAEEVADYVSPTRQRQLSCMANTAARFFSQVTLMPGQRLIFLCRDGPVRTDIPSLLKAKSISTAYIQRYFSGDLTDARIRQVNALVDTATPLNLDFRPYLMRVAFVGWLVRHGESPLWFGVGLALATLFYLTRISRPQWVLLTSGGINIGAEMVAIFTFQVLYGYIYLELGMLVTVFLAGLLPGAWTGGRFGGDRRSALMMADLLLGVLLVLFALLLIFARQALSVPLLYFFGLLISFFCGFQFPLALRVAGDGTAAAARSFSADLLGAAGGVLLVSLVLIPFLGLIGATFCLAGIKMISLVVAGTIDETA